MNKGLKPSDVFVPGKFPIEEANAYADRGTPQRDTLTALQRGYVPLVFGGYGVGKSSMVARVARGFHQSNTLVYVETVYGKSLDNIFQQVLEKLDYEVTIQRTENIKKETTVTGDAQIEGGVFHTLKAKFKTGISKNREQTRTELTELSAIPEMSANHVIAPNRDGWFRKLLPVSDWFCL